MIVYPRRPRVKPYTLAPSAKMAGLLVCIESGDDLDPVGGLAFGRAGWVGVDGRLTGYLFSLRTWLCWVVKKIKRLLGRSGAG